MDLWKLIPNSSTWANIWISLLARAAKAHKNDLSIYWDKYSDEIYSNILVNMNLALGNSKLVEIQGTTYPKSLNNLSNQSSGVSDNFLLNDYFQFKIDWCF